MGQIKLNPTSTATPAAQPINRPAAQPSATASTPGLSTDAHQATTAAEGSSPAVRFFFMSDSHSRPDLVQKIARIANSEQPDLVIDGGDIIHDGTEPELKRAYSIRQDFEAPVYLVAGNHDAYRRGPYSEDPPVIPPFQSLVHKGVHFILLDNESGTLSEAQFQQIEADLKAHSDKPSIVAMHVSPKLSQEPLTVKLGKVLPLKFASPQMTDPAQVARFHELMKTHDVKAVLTGHTHFPDEVLEDGVRYITAGSTGGLNPKPGIAKEFLDIRVENGEIEVQRVPLEVGKGMVGYAGEAIDFYRSLNDFNHSQLGWTDFYPSANLGYGAGLRHVTTERGSSMAATVSGTAERLMSDKGAVFGTVGISAGTGTHMDLGLQAGLGYKHAVVGDYNRGIYLSGAATGNAGYLHGEASAGVGLKAAVGAQYKNLTLELGQEWSTNYRAQTLSVGFRF